MLGQYQQFSGTKIGIFGSFARGEQTRRSDVNILVDFVQDMPFSVTLSGFPIMSKCYSNGK